MIRLKKLLLGTAVLAGLTATSGSDTRAEIIFSTFAKDYFPVAEGSTWTYRRQADADFPTSPTTKKLTSYSRANSDNQPFYSFVTSPDAAGGNENHTYYFSEGNLFDYGTKRLKYEPPKMILPHQVVQGATWTWEGRNIDDGRPTMPLKETYKIVGKVEVAVPAGNFIAAQIHCVNQEEGYFFDRQKVVDRTESDSYYAPAVGLIKYDEDNANSDLGNAPGNGSGAHSELLRYQIKQ